MERIERMLHKLFSEIAKKHHYEDVQLKAISSGGANYSSVLYTATVSSPNKEDLHLFAKVAVIGKELRAMATDEIEVFDIEYTVYSALAEKFKEIEDKCAVPEDDRYIFCKYYGYNPKLNEETIVLENLAAKGFIVYDRMKSVDWPYASKAVESLAKFHALAMVYGEFYPEECKKLSDKFKIIEQSYKMMDGILKTFVNQALKVTKAENQDKLANFFDNEVNCDVLHYTTPRRKVVLIHGDYRPSNLMHRVNEDGTVEVIPLDFQTIRAGNVVSDLLYFIFGSTDQEFRAKYYEQLIELYYQQLCRSLRLLHFDPEKIYSREDFETELKEISLLSTFIGRPLTAPACTDITGLPSSRLVRYERVEQLRQHFWKRWSTEYVTELQSRSKWRTNSDDIKLNTLVLLKEDNQPPLKWRLGRIRSVYPGKNGVSRVAEVLTATGPVKRAFSKICPLPLPTPEAEKQSAVSAGSSRGPTTSSA